MNLVADRKSEFKYFKRELSRLLYYQTHYL